MLYLPDSLFTESRAPDPLLLCLSFVPPSQAPCLAPYSVSSLNRTWERGTELFSKSILTTVVPWEHSDTGSSFSELEVTSICTFWLSWKPPLFLFMSGLEHGILAAEDVTFN